MLDLLAPRAAARGGGLIAVFGSAGERDTAKRPLMGRIAGERVALVIVTDEDPRGEDRAAILDAIARGAESAGKRRGHDLRLIADRATAIAAAFEAARPGDVVLLAGKGHERSIVGPTGELPWDERAVAREALLRGARPSSRARGRGPGLTRPAAILAGDGRHDAPPHDPERADRGRHGRRQGHLRAKRPPAKATRRGGRR